MKLLVLFVTLLTFGLVPAAVLSPGNGDAAAAVAAHNKDTPVGPLGGTQNGFQLLQLSGGGSIVHAHLFPAKPIKTKVKAADVAGCIAGTAQGCETTIEEDVNETAYLFIDGLHDWRIGTHANGDDATELTGAVDAKGGFMMSGTHALSNTSIFLTGKVKFEKGTTNYKSVAGKISAVSFTQGHYGTGNFKAVIADT